MDWRYGLVLFAVCWATQIAGTILQMRHYRRVLSGLTTQWGDGFIGSGTARSSFGRGAITILVVAPSGTVREALAMQGRTTWAKFKPLPALVGCNLEAIRQGSPFGPREARLADAFRAAVDQVEKIVASRGNAAALSAVATN